MNGDERWRHDVSVMTTGTLRNLLAALESDIALTQRRADFVRRIIDADDADADRQAEVQRQRLAWRQLGEAVRHVGGVIDRAIGGAS